MFLQLMLLTYEVFMAAFMKIRVLSLLPALYGALCETPPNTNLRDDHHTQIGLLPPPSDLCFRLFAFF